MLKTGLVYHSDYTKHNLGRGHPEKPERVSRTIQYLKNTGLLDNPSISLYKPEPARNEDLELVHTNQYIEKIKTLSQNGGMLTPDTPIPVGTYELAKLSIGGAILAGKLVTKREVRNSFALIRPPGHHAGKDFGGGFCYFNNIAIMIEYLKTEFNIQRFMIIDWDVHHGNGTQEIFYKDPTVLYFSTHEMPLYPGTGYMNEIGESEGRGYNINLPLPTGTSGGSYSLILTDLIEPLINEFKPEIITVSAGQDAYYEDPIANLQFTENTYAMMTQKLTKIADIYCKGRLVLVLEGGYNLNAIPKIISTIIKTQANLTTYRTNLQNRSKQQTDYEVENRIKQLKVILSNYWNVFR